MDTMKDTPMDLHPDYMCIPTIGNTDVYLKPGNTYAQELREYIEWFHEDHSIVLGVPTTHWADPMDPAAIY